MTRLLRFIALAIAIAGLVDPAISLSGASRARIAVVAQGPSSSVSENVRARLIHELTPSYEIVPYLTSDASAAVVIGDRYPEAAGPDTRVRPSGSMIVSTVTMPVAAASGVRIVRVAAPADVPTATLMHLDVELEGAGVAGQTTEVTAVMAGVEVGRASHQWLAGETRWRAGIDAVPLGDAPYVLRIAAGHSVADVVVDLRREPIRVEFFDPRPSWATTFVRRALEADARFQVAALSFTSRGVSAQTGGAVPLADPRLDAFAGVIAGGLDRLSRGDASALERFMRERGGAVVLLPDQRIDAGAARDLIFGPASGAVLDERLLERPAKLAVAPLAASLQASELLLLRAPTPGADVLARVPGAEPSAVIVSAPRGDGRLLFSGAMDAWRFRAADHGAFDRFWQSAIAGLALVVPPPIAIAVEPPLLRPAEQGEVIVRVRARDMTAVSAALDGQPIRLRPDPEAGVYRARFTAKATAGRSTLEVHAAGPQSQSASRAILVRPEVARLSTAAPALSMLASSHRGIDVPPDRLGDLEQFLRSTIASPRATVLRHPMRSVWWILPFAACLSAEWWIRRRRGRR